MHWFRQIVRGSQLCVLILLIVAALYISVGRIVLANLDEFREPLLRAVGQRMSLSIRADALSGQWHRLDPHITATGLVIGSGGVDAIRLDHGTFVVGTLQSLWERNLVIIGLTVNGISFSLTEAPDGTWQIQGLVPSGKPLSLDGLLDSLPWLDAVSISGMAIDVVSQRAHYQLSSLPDRPLQVIAGGRDKTFDLTLTASRVRDGQRTEISAVGDYRGDFRASDFHCSCFVGVSPVDLLDFIAMPAPLSPLSSAAAELMLWLEVSADGFSGSGKIGLAGRTRRYSHQLVTEVSFAGDRAGGYLRAGQVEVHSGEAMLMLEDVDVAVSRTDSTLKVAVEVPTVPLGGVASVLHSADEWGVPDLSEAIRAIRPDGWLEPLLISADLSGAKPQVHAVGKMVNVEINAFRGLPAIDRLSGLLSMGTENGFIDVTNEQFVMQFEPMFSQPWPFDSARGRINFRRQDDLLQISSSLIELVKDELTGAGKFVVNMTPDKAGRNWGLVVGVQNGSLLEARRFLPNTLPTDLRQWLNDSLLRGRTEETGLLFHGSLAKTAPKTEKTFDTYFKVSDVTLAYHPDWPSVEQVSARVDVDYRGAESEGATGRMFDTALSDVTVWVPTPDDGPAEALYITSRARGPLADGIRVLKDTPIAAQISNAAEYWVGSGEVSAGLELTVPLGRASTVRNQSDVTVTLAGNELSFNDYDLHAAGLDGSIRYETDTGLTAEGLSGTLFGEPFTGFIGSDVQGDTGQIVVNMAGAVAASDLYVWSNQHLLARVSGLGEYKASVHIPFGIAGARSYVQATSDLLGVALGFPGSFGKTADEQRLLYYRQEFLEPGHRIDLRMGDLQGSLEVQDEIVQGGFLHVGSGPAPDGWNYDSVRVTGALEHVDYAAWEQFLAEMDQISEAPLETEFARRVDAISLDIGLLDLYSLALTDARTVITRGESSWIVDLKNDLIAGQIEVSDEDRAPLDISLEYIRFPAGPEAGEASGADFMADFDPRDLGPVGFSTDELSFGEEQYGTWAFDLVPTREGAILENINARTRGLVIEPDARVDWYLTDAPRSRFRGKVAIPDLALALKQWGYASSIVGEDFLMEVDFRWPGSPAAVDIGVVSGELRIETGKGRFVQAESASALKLLGIFDFAQIARRFRFDFSDVVQKGWSFNDMRGVVAFDGGTVSVQEQIVIEGSSGTFKVGGTVDLIQETLDNDMIVTLPVTQNLPWYAAYSAIATGPLVGAGVMIAQKVFGSQIDQMTSTKYRVTGTVEEPKIEFVSIFNDSVRESPPDESTVDEAEQTPHVMPESPQAERPRANSDADMAPNALADEQTPPAAGPEE